MAQRPSLIPAEPEELTPPQQRKASSRHAKTTSADKAWLAAMAANITGSDANIRQRLSHALRADQLANLMRHHKPANDESDDDA